jgi:hypothetical protein
MSGGGVVLNNAFEDTLYEMATTGTETDEDEHFYELQHPQLAQDPFQQARVYELAPEPPPRVTRPAEIRLWPLWAAHVATAALAITALVHPMFPTEHIESASAEEVTAPPWWTSTPTMTPGCTCTPGTLAFAFRNPGGCYSIADGSNGTPNLLQNGGLYIRAGAPALVGQVLDQGTAVNGLNVRVTAELSEELPPVFHDCNGAPGHYLSQNKIEWISPLSGGGLCSDHINTTTTLNGDAETRPPSMYLTPYFCV